MLSEIYATLTTIKGKQGKKIPTYPCFQGVTFLRLKTFLLRYSLSS